MVGAWEWSAASKLNTVRNHLAHRIEPTDVERKIAEFYAAVPIVNAERDAKIIESFGPMHWYIGMLYMSLSAKLHVVPGTVLSSGGGGIPRVL